MAKKVEDEGAKGPQHISALDRLIEATIADASSLGHENDPARQQWPVLWEWMTRTRSEDGDYALKPGVLSVQMTPSGVSISITMRDMGKVVTIACDHLGDALEALNRSLASGNPPIRDWGKGEPRLRKRRKS